MIPCENNAAKTEGRSVENVITLVAAATVPASRFLLGLLNGMMAASKTLVPEVCGKEHQTVGMGVVTSEFQWQRRKP